MDNNLLWLIPVGILVLVFTILLVNHKQKETSYSKSNDEEEGDEENPAQSSRQNPTQVRGTSNLQWYEVWKRRWWQENELAIVAAFVLYNIGGYLLLDDWWTTHMWTRKVLGVQAILLAFAWMIPTGDKSLHNRVGRWGLFIFSFGLIIYLGYDTIGEKIKNFSNEVQNQQTQQRPVVSQFPVITSPTDKEFIGMWDAPVGEWGRKLSVPVELGQRTISSGKVLILLHYEDGTEETMEGDKDQKIFLKRKPVWMQFQSRSGKPESISVFRAKALFR